MAELHADNLADEKRDTGVTFAELPHVTLRHQDMHPQQTISLDIGSLGQTLLMRHNQHASATPDEEPGNFCTTHPNLPQISERHQPGHQPGFSTRTGKQ